MPTLPNYLTNLIGTPGGFSVNWGGYVPTSGSSPITSSSSERELNDAELRFIDQFYSGDIGRQLETNRNNYRGNVTSALGRQRDQSQTLLNSILAELTGRRTGYQSSADNLISGQEVALGANRRDYFSKAQADITKDLEDSAKELAEFEQAERGATDRAIAGGVRQQKAMFSKSGGGASSYASRLATGTRLAAETDLARRLADRKAGNRTRIAGRQSALDAALSDRERADLTSIFGDRSRLLEAITSMDRNDLNFRYGQQSDLQRRLSEGEIGLEQDLATRGADDLRYILNMGTNLLGRRGPLLLTTTTRPPGTATSVSTGPGYMYPYNRYIPMI